MFPQSQLLTFVHSFMFTNSFVLCAILLVTLIFVHRKNDYEFWSRRGINGPKPLPFMGNSLEHFLKPATTVCSERFKKFGRVYGYYERSKPVLCIAEPELLRHVMVKDSDTFLNRVIFSSSNQLIKRWLLSLRDNEWKQIRSIICPTFTSRKIRKMTRMVNDCIKSLLASLDSKVNNNEEIDLKSLYGAFTMDVIASCAFSINTNSHSNPNDPFVVNAKKFLTFKLWRVLFAVFMPKFMKRLTRFTTFPGEAIEFFKKITKEIIEHRQKKGKKFKDFIQLLLDAYKTSDLSQAIKDINSEQLNAENQDENENTVKILSTAKGGKMKLTDDEVLAQCLMFFVGGYETTASLLTYSTYALAVNSNCQELLYEEVKHVYSLKNEFSYESINEMKYLSAVINESLRMYTPIIQTHREAGKDYTFPNTGISIPKGTMVMIPLYTIHTDENNFPDPFSFKPERFLPENKDQIKPYTFLPFGSGPRNCLGMRFALMEAKLLICNLILRYKFVKCDKTDVPLKLKRFTSLFLPFENAIVKFEKREKVEH